MLLHHVMGELDGIRGAWGYPEGGMGAVSAAIAKSALSVGAQLFTDSAVKEVNYSEKFSLSNSSFNRLQQMCLEKPMVSSWSLDTR